MESTLVGIIGAGYIARQHALRWRMLGYRVAIFSRSGSKALAREVGGTAYAIIEDFWRDVEFVDICTPTGSHGEYAIEAARHGRDIICEKPLCLSVEEAATIISAARISDVQLHVAQVVRHFPEYRVIRDEVMNGAVGEVAVLRLARESYPPSRAEDSWLFQEELSGGIIADLMSHDIDYAIWLAGPVDKVYAKTVKTGNVVPDHAFAVLTHESGALSHLTASWAQKFPRFRTRIEVAGDKGLIAYDSEEKSALNLWSDSEFTESGGDVGFPGGNVPADLTDPMSKQLADFGRMISEGEQNSEGFDSLIERVRVVSAVRSSAINGTVETIENG